MVRYTQFTVSHRSNLSFYSTGTNDYNFTFIFRQFFLVMDIIVDTTGQTDLLTRDRLVYSDDDDFDFEDTGTQRRKFFDIEENLLENDVRKKKITFNVSKDINLDEFESEMGWSNTARRDKNNKTAPNVIALKQEVMAIDAIMKNSVIKPGSEQLKYVHNVHVSKRKLQARKHRERAKTKGTGWFNMPAPEITPEIKHDLQVLQMRSVLDPKHFYKKNDLKVLPKYFQIGKVVDTPLDYYSGRLTKKERKKTIVDELMADAEFSKYNKRKYKEIIDEKNKSHHKAHKRAKKLKGKKK
uniref:deoxynucleotidyltransferase terminal-interacting protein 2 isoform X1 n=1 Tax=Osmia lignaria TaxID=473952 RepID=UPI001478322D|nr:deoxynucleotidyltransferase terminal-interacting protein 2 isoform X1 [Osmia lignaria]